MAQEGLLPTTGTTAPFVQITDSCAGEERGCPPASTVSALHWLSLHDEMLKQAGRPASTSPVHGLLRCGSGGSPRTVQMPWPLKVPLMPTMPSGPQSPDATTEEPLPAKRARISGPGPPPPLHTTPCMGVTPSRRGTPSQWIGC